MLPLIIDKSSQRPYRLKEQQQLTADQKLNEWKIPPA